MFSAVLLFFALPFASALPTTHDTYDHPHNVDKRLPDTWYLPKDHAVHSLFSRAPDDGVNYAQVGSPSAFVWLTQTFGLDGAHQIFDSMVKRIPALYTGSESASR